ncbi:PP2C family protein-serine/threonine phosphatase [Agaribacter marinus]|uniref:Serine/threonine protein phosphatase n=1 Tax=Agaribacter marinus TaxID=1431249 RepID=A0AA37SXV2_9ALTE|nr:protein phosphatase 2C domain-containing protein [Agaribacter marinus]GLR71908.1 serine/threonine protein phosphatase [Agaribacter marinus]
MSNSGWTSIAETNIGTVRKVNEDDFLDLPEAQLWCVADGMGGHAKGDVASQLITKTLSDLASNAPEELSVDSICDCIKQTNYTLIELSNQHNSIVGSTVVALFFTAEHAHLIWAGDSRIYRLRSNTLERVTRDHSQVEDMIDAGLISPEEAETHPKANVITRAVGAAVELDLDVKTLPLEDGDQFLLCSDGLNKVMNDLELEHALKTMDTKTISNRLIEIALNRKARDNVTVIVVRNEKQIEEALHETLPLDDTLPLHYSNKS